MTPDQIKAKAIMAAAEVIWDRLVTSIPFIGPWAAARDEDRAGIIAEATAIVTAYERAMVRSLADAPPYDPSGRRTRALLWVPGWQTWCFGEVWRGKDNTPRALVSRCPWENDDLQFFRLPPDAPEPKP